MVMGCLLMECEVNKGEERGMEEVEGGFTGGECGVKINEQWCKQWSQQWRVRSRSVHGLCAFCINTKELSAF